MKIGMLSTGFSFFEDTTKCQLVASWKITFANVGSIASPGFQPEAPLMDAFEVSLIESLTDTSKLENEDKRDERTGSKDTDPDCELDIGMPRISQLM